jgi:hypothetical protein
MRRQINAAVRAALDLQRALEEGGFPHCFIGGLAIQRWGEPRMTNDADATVLTQFHRDEELADFLLGKFAARRADAKAFALRNRVLLLVANNGVNLDIGLGALDFEMRSIERSTFWTYTPRRLIRTCSAEDLVVHKAFAGRDRDWIDVDMVLLRQGQKLNVPQVFEELVPLAELKEDCDTVPRLQTMMRKRGVLE